MLAKYHITVYGRDQICASCVGAPGSKETYEWLKTLLKRRYNEADFSYEYVDMDEEPTSETHRQMIDKMEEEDMFYPLVLLNGKIIAEGIPNPKEIFKAIESLA